VVAYATPYLLPMELGLVAAVLYHALDGLRLMVLEALAHGRHVLWTHKFPGCNTFSTAEDARERIRRLQILHQDGSLGINAAGVKAIAEQYRPELLKPMILDRLQTILES
jgi:hypothetical protein